MSRRALPATPVPIRPAALAPLSPSGSSVCLICLNDDAPVEPIPCASCRESFVHAECLVPWLLRGGTCPTCRAQLIRGGAEEEEEVVGDDEQRERGDEQRERGGEQRESDGESDGEQRERGGEQGNPLWSRSMRYLRSRRIQHLWPAALLLIHVMLGTVMFAEVTRSPSPPFSAHSSVRDCVVVSHVVVDMTVLLLIADAWRGANATPGTRANATPGRRARQPRRVRAAWHRLGGSSADWHMVTIAGCILMGIVVAGGGTRERSGADPAGKDNDWGSSHVRTDTVVSMLGSYATLLLSCVPAVFSRDGIWRLLFLAACSVFGTCCGAMKAQEDAFVLFWVIVAAVSGSGLGVACGKWQQRGGEGRGRQRVG